METASSVLSEHVAKHANSKVLQSVALDDWWDRCASNSVDSPDFLKLDVHIKLLKDYLQDLFLFVLQKRVF